MFLQLQLPYRLIIGLYQCKQYKFKINLVTPNNLINSLIMKDIDKDLMYFKLFKQAPEVIEDLLLKLDLLDQLVLEVTLVHY